MTMYHANESLSMEVMSAYVCSEAARSLTLLKTIDVTIDMLVMITKQLGAFVQPLRGLKESVLTSEAEIAEGQIVPALEGAQDQLSSLYSLLAKRFADDRRCLDLRPDDGVAESYEAALETIALVNEEVEEYRWAIMEHNADLEPEHKPALVSDAKGIADFFAKL